MQIVEIGILNTDAVFTYFEPFIVRFQPGTYEAASYWIDTFSATDETTYFKKYIDGFIRGAFNAYGTTDTLNDCRSTEKTLYWDNENQIGYIHLEHSYFSDYQSYSYETYLIYTNDRFITIDDQECLPYLISAPQARQQQDIVNYDKFSFISGTFSLDNVGGELDFYKDLKLYNNNAFSSYIDNDDITEIADGVYIASRTDIKRLQAFYIENPEVTISKVNISVQDVRKAQDVLICTDVFTREEYPYINEDLINEVIPIQSGPIRECKPINIDNEFMYNVKFRVALEMTDIGIIQVNVDDEWTTVTPLSTNVSKGEFVLSKTDCRDVNGKLYETRVLDSIGFVNTYSSDVIISLNEKYINLGFLESFYNTTEWNLEKLSLSGIGVRFDEQIPIFEAINKIQNGGNIGFRYEINPNGKRTIRIDKNQRPIVGILHNTNIDNILTLGANGNPKHIYSEIFVKYDMSYLTKKLLLTTNNDYADYVGAEYKKKNTLTVETLLTNKIDADERAAFDALRFKDDPQIIKLNINTPTKEDRDLFLQLRIFDTLYCELTPAEYVDIESGEITGREFLGLKYVKILSINPNPDKQLQQITAQILTDRTDLIYNHYDFTEHGIFSQQNFDFTETSGQDNYDFTEED